MYPLPQTHTALGSRFKKIHLKSCISYDLGPIASGGLHRPPASEIHQYI